MSATRAFARKEIREVLHTWRLWVLPGLMLFLGITAPVMAALLPKLAEYAAGKTPGTVIKIASPTAIDAYIQFLANLQQMGSLAVAIIGGGIIAAEVRGGSAALTLAKPLARGSYVLTKAAVLGLLTLAATTLGGVVCIAVTAAVFGIGPAGHFVAAVGCWLLLATVFVALATLLSATLRSQMAAAVCGAAAVIGLGVLSQIGVVGEYTPAGLWTASSALLTGTSAPLLVPIVTAAGVAVALLAAAVQVFRRREI
jgi:ABC-2 type transport system permease protein